MLLTWTAFHKQLRDIETIQVPRFFGSCAQPRWFLHGFSDTLEHAYAVALYLVCQDADQQWTSSLIIAKSKVAPIKTLSIPRLELSGAHLLARLIAALSSQLLHPPAQTFCWSDSTVTLAWLRENASYWKTFVATRVSDIQNLLPNVSWHHVVSKDNPADCASRVLSPEQLRTHTLWWKGPTWLRKDWSTWTPSNDSLSSDLERRHAPPVLHVALQPAVFDQHISRFSTYKRLTHSYAYVVRWLTLLRSPRRHQHGKILTAEEIELATHGIVRAIQAEFYTEELQLLRNQEPLPRTSSIRRCLPFIDELGILRVGGRLQNFALSYEEKHPALIPLDSHLAKLLIQDHIFARYKEVHSWFSVNYTVAFGFHGLATQSDAWFTNAFDVPGFKDAFKNSRGLRCRLHGQTSLHPLPRVVWILLVPFQFARVRDEVKDLRKAMSAFSSALPHEPSTLKSSPIYRRRCSFLPLDFIGRRGLCHTVFSDNGTNFHGASTEITRLFHEASDFSAAVAETLANDGVSWKFIPPRTPQFGSLWEAGVKSFKHHLKRVLGDATLTFEEFYTVAAQIEACLNSRPISPLSSDPEDLSALTPGHFLIGRALTALPEPSDLSLSLSLSLSLTIAGVARYQLATVMRNHSWCRWQTEALNQYQLRAKWFSKNTSLQTGDLVLITDINLPATKWPMARVLQLHPGNDGLSHVATLRTAASTLKCPLAKLIRLPLEKDSAMKDSPTAGGLDLSKAGGSDNAAVDGEGSISNHAGAEED